ncbi:MAG: molybdopterin-guanine dinucleotide biosynthesis protein MobB [Ignisphaera sp.]|nr:molybdopterin-guanine dinucleotide biosynthesis protein MobB [Ignisphaera sp.]MCX8167431.1 molybdopterin-guanine dinucleotide biosynthesis protein MobB [Ignisphaera sp.]MDW8086080.1 molybdopterin-guanine dinucleotide biosynthesis protein MobB [Ignisphaera sp.]
MRPYVLRFVSLESRKGKTSIAASVVSKLKLKGYLIACVKHTGHGVDVSEKDTGRYISAGADIVVASSSDIGAVYYSRWVDSLENILSYIDTPIVIVEGFKRSGVGDVIAITDAIDEFEALAKKVVGNITAIVCNKLPTETGMPGLTVFSRDDIDGLTSFIESKALKFLESQLPQNNCGLCGYETCAAFVKMYAMGKTRQCPISSGIRLLIDNREIPLNPFVKNVLRSTIDGFIIALKGIPQHRKRISIEIEL